MPKIFQHIRRNIIGGDSMKKYLFYALGEIALVIIGILVALQINNWNEARKAKNHQDAVLLSIHDEIVVNLELIKDAAPRRQVFLASLDSLSKAMSKEDRKVKFYDVPSEQRLPGWTGANPLNLSGSMFETSKYSDVLSSLDVELLKTLSQTYNKQEILNDTGFSLIDKLFDFDSETEYSEVIRLMWRVQEEFFGGQYLLMQDYQKSIDLINERLSK